MRTMFMAQRRFLCLGLLWVFCVIFLSAGNAVADEQLAEYVLTVMPQSTAQKAHEQWAPVVEYLSAATKTTIKLKLFESIPECEAAIMKGEADFVYMNPYMAVLTHKSIGYIPLIHDDSKLTGVLVVRVDSAFKDIRDIDGKIVAFPAPNAFGASLYMRALLREKEKISFTENYVKTHDNVYRHVVLGKAFAGGGVMSTLKKQPEDVQKLLRVVYTTPGAAPLPLVANPRVPVELREAVKAAILRLQETPEGRKMLEAISIPHPVVADYQRDYQPLDGLGLEKYVVQEN